jgi:formyltetrahydrofolate synthetase
MNPQPLKPIKNPRAKHDFQGRTCSIRAVGSYVPARVLTNAELVIEACREKASFRFLYPLDMSIKDKITRIATTTYGAREVVFSEEASKKALMLRKLKLDALPICVVKTPFSLSHSPKKKGRPHGFKLPIEDIELRNGAGYISAYCGNVKTMPGRMVTVVVITR